MEMNRRTVILLTSLLAVSLAGLVILQVVRHATSG